MVELLNFHSHSDRTITIKVMEGSTTYIIEGSYIINITQVLIESYSKITTTPIKAKIITIMSESVKGK